VSDSLAIPSTTDSVYILITQCLQNSFFMSEECRLCLPQDMVAQMLIGTGEAVSTVAIREPVKNQRVFDSKLLKQGPLYQFFNCVINDPARAHQLNIIHIKDWHTPTLNYDGERRQYGAHCVADTLGAASLTKEYEPFFTPWGKDAIGLKKARSTDGYVSPTQTNNRFYELHSDSLHDFQRVDGQPSCLEQIFDKILAKKSKDAPVYVVVIGVYTDIKIVTLMSSLRMLYKIENLIVSDVLTAAPTLERHIAGLDYCEKVLKAEVIHSLNELVSVFEPHSKDPIPLDITRTNPDFRQYHSYFQDKQSVLLFQDAKLAQYIDYTGRRTTDMFAYSMRMNKILTYFGIAMLALTIGATLLHFLRPEVFTTDALLITGGLSLIQVVAIFFRNPMQNMRSDINTLVRLRNYLESYSTITALLRHHLTAPEYLKGPRTPEERTTSLGQLREQLDIVQDVIERMSQNFRDMTSANPGESDVPPNPQPDPKAGG